MMKGNSRTEGVSVYTVGRSFCILLIQLCLFGATPIRISAADPEMWIVLNRVTNLSDDYIITSAPALVGVHTPIGNARIYVTLDGSEPSPLHGIPSGGPFVLNAGITRIRAVSYNTSMTVSLSMDVIVDVRPLVSLTLRGPYQGMEYRRVDSDGRIVVQSHASDYAFVSAPKDTVIQLYAPEAGFLEWRGFVQSDEPVLEVLVDRPRELEVVYGTSWDPAISGNGQVVVEPAEHGEIGQMTAIPDEGHFFVGWYPGVHPISYSTRFPAWDVSRADFAPLPEGYFTLNLKGEKGITFPAIGKNAFAAGSTVPVHVQVAEGFAFTHWSGDATGTVANIQVTMDENKSMTAHSRRIVDWSPYLYSGNWRLAVGPDGIVYATTEDSLYALNRFGLFNWTLTFSGETALTPVIGPDERLYIVGESSVWKVTSDGRIEWERDGGGDLSSINGSGLFVVDNLENGGVLRRSALIGNASEDVALPAPARQLASTSNGSILVLSANKLEQYSADLQLEWDYALPNGFDGRWFAVYKDGRIFVGGTSLIALDADGEFLWEKPYDTYAGGTLGVDRLYINVHFEEGGTLYALDLEGNFLWAVPRFVSTELSLSTVALADGSLLQVSEIQSPTVETRPTGVVRHLSAEGKILWGTSLGHVDQFPETLGVLDPDGRLIFGFIGKLYGSQIGIAPARSGWPMPSGSWRNANFPYVDSSEGRQHDVLYAYSSENSMSLRFTSSAVDTDLVLETSTDLENWMEVLTSTDEIDFTVSTETGDRFYRVRRAAADK